MFARQIAVMKGQAWNVVETLKQPDHGPLELTRRMRVCVWDDLVDIPVAIPLRAPSGEMQNRRVKSQGQAEEEEMDISAAISPQPGVQHDLLSLSPPQRDLPNPNRFELSRGRDSVESSRAGERTTSPVTLNSPPYGNLNDLGEGGRELASSWSPAPPCADGRRHKSTGEFARRGTHKKPASPQHRRDSTVLFGGDDLEGDLGYAAAEEMEGHERKVIVERLEAVKSKNPFFTWC